MESCFYTLCNPIEIGCKLYQNNLATILVDNGYYSNGNNCFNVSGGTVIEITVCEGGSNIYCYSATDIAQSPTIIPCLGTDYPANPYQYTITLYDASGNTAVATSDYTFDVVFDVQLCTGESGPYLVELTVLSGSSSVSYLHYDDETVECGFGCTSEYQRNPVITGTPTQLPLIVECII